AGLVEIARHFTAVLRRFRAGANDGHGSGPGQEALDARLGTVHVLHGSPSASVNPIAEVSAHPMTSIGGKCRLLGTIAILDLTDQPVGLIGFVLPCAPARIYALLP